MLKQALVAISLLFPVASIANNACMYSSKQDDGNFSLFDDCGVIDGDTLSLSTFHQNNVVYDNKGLTCILMLPGTVFYLHENGRSQRVYFYDNGCDYFKDGLARGLVNDQMVFINEQLDVVLAPGFEWLSVFDYDHVMACNGPFVTEKDGEYSFMTGGKCGLLNRQGDLVVEANYNIEDRDFFQNYINANNHCPPPPIVSKESALCHAKRHISNMQHHGDNWKRHEISQSDGKWLVTFAEMSKPNDELTLILVSDSAHWQTLIEESHDTALRRVSVEQRLP